MSSSYLGNYEVTSDAHESNSLILKKSEGIHKEVASMVESPVEC